MNISGVYQITNNITGDFYIGSSKNIKQRWANHKSPSMWKQHPNSKLYKDMASYGKDKFIFEVIEETTDLKEREQYWIKQLGPTYNDRYADGYNIKRRKESTRRRSKEWYKAHQNEKLAHNKAYYQAHRDERLAYSKAKSKDYYSRLCLYNGETLTLRALSNRFFRQGIPHPTLNAKTYLILK